ncbi:EamA-like transporter family protein [Tistlia consotensis]|uniref:EamA-like transporter family protein n=1 Tax=Tistlia consotensis USBA 355 TaxID=560819 RepID=A0A1Y6CNP3_9PROT|nr:DMT family transporter [Tistlia consotensis]SMF65600.1 EamA-like transporter family protein [Tistlia consotensis USBA 355]SNS03523.1 EamA-like transporter family protein [Tistlia consotensis]
MEALGVAAAMLSSALGGTAVGATRYLAGALDPVTIGALRFGGGFLLLLPLALLRRDPWPARRDLPAALGLGLLFFGLFPVLFNAALAETTAARGALALSTLPLLTLAVAALLGVEPLSARKLAGVLVAMAGVAVALAAGLKTAPASAWRGDLLMVAAAFCMALYSVWSRPVIARSGPVPFTAAAMAAGALCLLLLSAAEGGLHRLAGLGTGQWIACGYLAAVCGAAIFFLWAFALRRTTPTLVAISVTVNPVTASLVGLLLLGEPIGADLLLGLAAVLAGIAIATGLGRRRTAR